MWYGIGSGFKSNHKNNKNVSNSELYKQIKRNEKETALKRLSYLETISNHILLPPDVAAGMPYVTVCGRSSVCIENHKKILTYSDAVIEIQVRASGIIRIDGETLKIAYYTKEELKICGIIKSISYV